MPCAKRRRWRVHDAHAGPGRTRPLRCGLIDEHLGPLGDELGLDHEGLMGLGRVDPQNPHETFCMTVLAFKTVAAGQCGLQSARRASVGECGPRLWPWRSEESPDRPHHQRRARADLAGGANARAVRPRVCRTLVPADRRSRMSGPAVRTLTPGELWETHQSLKNRLIVYFARSRADARGANA